jgi:hypothetical protein
MGAPSSEDLNGVWVAGIDEGTKANVELCLGLENL